MARTCDPWLTRSAVRSAGGAGAAQRAGGHREALAVAETHLQRRGARVEGQVAAGAIGALEHGVQRRVGRGYRRFGCIKFRTMRPNADRLLARVLEKDPDLKAEYERDFKLRRDPRITWIGYWLRRSSLDELPQFLNVLRGEMRQRDACVSVLLMQRRARWTV